METLITDGIRISVRTEYQPEYTSVQRQQYIFSYHIIIENCNDYTVQLLRRHWVITNSFGEVNEVEGKGVLGKQPILEPGETHSYSSWCPLTSTFGYMDGSYLMAKVENGELFQAQIPRFKMAALEILN